jgi:uncharacterized lipoprotein YddW (UPF0748 family)
MQRRVLVRADRVRLPFRLVSVFVGLTVLMSTPIDLRAAANAPLRPFWMARSSLDTLDAIRRAVTTAASGGFDTVMIPVTLGAEPSLNFDGARETLRETRERGLRAYAWLDVTRVAGTGELPSSRDHVLYRHPEWLMVPRDLAAEISKVDVRSPAYLGRLARWTRVNADRIDGLYISPLSPEAVSYLVAAVSAAAKRYAVDGVFLDTIRFPGVDFDYSRHAMEIFRADTRPQLAPDERARLDEVEAIDPFGYAEEFPDRWREFRQSRLTTLMATLRKTLAGINPSLVVSAGLASEPAAALTESFQDWPQWLKSGLVDGIGRRSGTSGTIVFTPDDPSVAAALPSTNQTPGTIAIP